jgi:NAD(P)-dependent dehydrogenase (short-subunit alcohol dehydrogenase family)
MVPRMQLSGKVVVVLGGGGLLGSAFVRECVTQGATVVVADLKDPSLSGAHYMRCDALDEAQTSALAEQVVAEFGRVDGVINATYPAATKAGDNGVFEEGDLDGKLESVVRHLRVCFVAVRAFAPIFRSQKSGALVFMSSIYGFAAPRFDLYDGLPMTQPAEYAAAKGGILAITRYFASLLGRSGVRVNCISPGGIAQNQPKEFIERYSKKVLLGEGLLSPQDIAGAAAFLVSDASAKMTGQNLIIDAGWTL